MERRTWRLILAAVALGVLAVTLTDLYETMMGKKVYEKYGWHTTFYWKYSFEKSKATGQHCVEVTQARPPAHWNWKGETWQEPYFDWDDIVLLNPAPTVFNHGRTGPIKEGEFVCGWSGEGWLAAIYKPEDYLIHCQQFGGKGALVYPRCEIG